ncbi:uncharacterized protein LOC110944659 [Helianthus annuus]|uniref:uncharacterized protein LOC110944659 n=1 Tax=Helianthus annuus TaxID=4232 RepID=UPI000B907037|nr:uncharacterized protein LOC110944659 [Helianthus annuus]
MPRRRNSEFNPRNAEIFNHFILSAGLQEYNMGGGKYTYISDNGEKLSKLDRFLVCLGFMERWPTTSVLALDRDSSDHRPIILTTVQSDFGHTPFRLFNSWLEYPGFMYYVLQVCGSFVFSGPEELALTIKLRWLKTKIKAWIKEENGRSEGLYGVKKSRLAALDTLAEDRELGVEELQERAELENFVAEHERLRQMDTRQKSRTRWAIDGDENSAFFHQIINSNLSNNRVNGLMVDGVWETNPLVIKETFYEFFSKPFKEPLEHRPDIVCPNINTISESEANLLVAPFSSTEIKNAIWSCAGDRAPGPDGFNFKFIKRCGRAFNTILLEFLTDFTQKVL